MGAKYFGAAVKRREDPRFLRGEARYVDDVKLAGMLHAAFLRSPHSHARILAIHAEAARALPGVAAVFTFVDLERWMKPLPIFGAPPPGLAAAIRFDVRQAPQWALCRDRARYVGEIVAMVVAESRARAEDAVGLIEVEWEPLPPVADMVEAGEAGSPLIHPEWGTNVAVSFTHAIGDPDAAFAGADVVVSETFRIQRYVGMPIEGRGVVALWDRRDGTLTTWNSTQVPHFVQQGLTTTLGLPPHKIRVIAPDLGGGFGTKASGYAEDALVPIASIVLSRPVKWIEDRREHMAGAAHARHQTHTIGLAAKRDGTIVGLRDRIWLDLGAYNVWGIVLPYNTVAHLIGPHRIKSMRVDVRGVVTNKTPNAPYRGAGRPEAVFAMDRALDCLARELRMDPAEIRRCNYIRADELPYDLRMPYRDGNPLVYDTGDFPAALEGALAAAGYDEFRKEQELLRAARLGDGGRRRHRRRALRHRNLRQPERGDGGQFHRRCVPRGAGQAGACRGDAARGRARGHRARGRPGVRPRLAAASVRPRAGGAGLDPDLRRARHRVARLRGERLPPRADRHLRERSPRGAGGGGCRDRWREAPALRRRP